MLHVDAKGGRCFIGRERAEREEEEGSIKKLIEGNRKATGPLLAFAFAAPQLSHLCALAFAFFLALDQGAFFPLRCGMNWNPSGVTLESERRQNELINSLPLVLFCRSPLSFLSLFLLTSTLLFLSPPPPPKHTKKNSPVVSTAAASLPGQRSTLENVTETLTTLFPVWVCAGAALGIAKPAAFAWFKTDLFTYSLGFLMLSMGLTLTVDDFRQCLKNPVPVRTGGGS